MWRPYYVLTVCSLFRITYSPTLFPHDQVPDSSRRTPKALRPKTRGSRKHCWQSPPASAPVFRFAFVSLFAFHPRASESCVPQSLSLFTLPITLPFFRPLFVVTLSSLTHLTFDNLTPYFPFTISDAHLYTVIVKSVSTILCFPYKPINQ